MYFSSLEMQTVADMRGVGVKNREKFADVLCGRPLTMVIEQTKIGHIFRRPSDMSAIVLYVLQINCKLSKYRHICPREFL